MNDRADILQVVGRRNAAIARGDAEAVVAPLSEDVEFYSLAPPLVHTGAAARDIKAVKSWFSTWSALPEVDLPAPTVLIDGDLAVVFGLATMRGTKAESGDNALWYRSTIVLRRQGGDWAIVHEHESVPFLMDGSDKAALNLEPEFATA